MSTKKRLDLILTEKNYFKSRSEAASFIRAGMVFINNQNETKPGKYFDENTIKEIVIKEKPKYVSRGGYKLEKALNVFKIDVNNKVCLDIGASTGGFTDCLLQNNAKKVYAVDVGYGQIDLKLRNHPKVVLIERTNIRYIDKTIFKEKIDIITIDVSFISVEKFLLNLLDLLNKDASIIILFKPQFEAEPKDVKKGIIKDKEVHIKVISRFFEFLKSNNLKMVNLTFSPIKGSKGNIEFLLLVKKEGENVSLNDIKRVVEESWLNLY